MTTTTRPLSHVLAPALLVLGTMLAAGNWYLRPGHALAWSVAVALLGGMTLAYLLAAPRADERAGAHATGDSIARSIVFAALMVVCALGAKLALTLGALHDADLASRTTLVIVGAWFVLTGNALPKTLTPLSAMRGDPARVQSFRRVMGWVWVLTGLALALAWLVLPVGGAIVATFLLMPAGALVLVGQVQQLRRSDPPPA